MMKGFDVIIVSTQNSFQEEFWQKKLLSLTHTILRKNTIVLAIAQSWNGDPGTGLGFLNAYVLAQEKAKFKYQIDLFQLQKEGASIALYLADYVEKKLFPLLAYENCSLASLKLPPYHNGEPRSLLETVIKQTGQVFSDNREGRLSVFFIHQLFFPSAPFVYTPHQHIDLFCQKISPETDYSTHIENPSSIQNREKKKLISLSAEEPKVFESDSRDPLLPHHSVGKNLNSFSLSTDITFALIKEFQPELSSRKGFLDSDAHLWTPLTLDFATFLKLKPTPEHQMQYHRMRSFREKCKKELPSLPFFQAIDIGISGYHWNFGSIQSFHQSLLQLTRQEPEGCFMRHFFEIDHSSNQLFENRIITDRNSCLINCRIQGGSIKNSVIIGVIANAVKAENSVIINSQFSSLISSACLLYHVQETRPLKLAAGTVRTDAMLSHKQRYDPVYSHLNRNVSQDWNRVLPQNPLSFSAMNKKILTGLSQSNSL